MRNNILLVSSIFCIMNMLHGAENDTELKRKSTGSKRRSSDSQKIACNLRTSGGVPKLNLERPVLRVNDSLGKPPKSPRESLQDSQKDKIRERRKSEDSSSAEKDQTQSIV